MLYSMNIESNQDIFCYIWTFINPKDYKKMAIVSKTSNNYYKSLSNSHKLYEVCVTKNNCDFIKYIVNQIASKFNYSNNPLFIKILDMACYNNNIMLHQILTIDTTMIFSDIIEIFIHSVNYKYKILINILNELFHKYDNMYLDFNHYIYLIKFYLHLFNDKYLEKPSIYTEYSNRSRELIKISLMVHLFSIIDISNDANLDKLCILQNIKILKLKEICDSLKEGTYFACNHPNYFKKNIFKIYLNI